MVATIVLFACATANLISHEYRKSEEVVLWFNKVFSYNNPHEFYAYKKIGLCVGNATEHVYALTLGEAIEGHELYDSRMGIQYLVNAQGAFCELEVSEKLAKKIVDGVRDDYWVQMYIDDLPVWGRMGYVKDEKVFLYTHYGFVIHFNGKNIIKVDHDKGNGAELTELVEFTYSVEWKYIDFPFNNRFSFYLDPGFFEDNVH